MQDWSATVIVPTYNHEQQLVEAMNSVVRQDIFPKISVIIGDDNSTDRTFDIAGWYQHTYENIKVVRHPERLGVLGNYAELTKRCMTDYIAVLEGDDIWIAPDKLRRQIEFLTKNPSIDACFSEFLCLIEDTGHLYNGPSWADGRYRVLNILDLLFENSPATFSTCCYRSEVFHEVICRVQGTEAYDWLVNMLVSESNGFAFIPKPSAIYRVSPKGLWTGASTERKRALRVHTIEKALELLVCEKNACYFHDYLDRILTESVN